MPKVSRETASQAVTLEGHQIHTEDLEGGYSVCFESHTADADVADWFRGLPDDRCQVPRWGYVLAGMITFRFAGPATRRTWPATPTTCRRATRPSTTPGRRSSSSARRSRSTRRSASSWATSSARERRHDRPEHIETVVIGAGQAGLSVGHHLAKRGRPFVILDANERVGDNWRRHWDSLRLFSPARLDGLPGMAFPAPGWSFPTKDQTADYLEHYAERFELPVRGGTRVERIARDGEGYLVDCDDGQIAADNVVVATGTFGRPFTPAFAGELDPRIVQLHSSEYQRPSLLLDGPVLVVGASHSGADVAMDVAPTHRDDPRRPRHGPGAGRHREPARPGRLARAGVPGAQGPDAQDADGSARCAPRSGRTADRCSATGGPTSRPPASSARPPGSPASATAGRCSTTAPSSTWRTSSGAPASVRTSAGSTCRSATRTAGRARSGASSPRPPACTSSGLAFQYAFSSMLLLGAGRDAEHVAGHIATRMAERRVAVAA